jgi:alkylated DNA repair dioxygenase AlkB
LCSSERKPHYSFPIYRHPADESPPLHPFSPTVALIREHVQKAISHSVNHVLIQYYRSGADYISEHSDKTIDVVRGSKIVNISLGAQRVMTLRMKKDGARALERDDADSETRRPAQRIPLPHNSMFVMGPETNARWLHGINRDRRFIMSKSPAEQRESGARISLTFRLIGTFLTKDERWIYGQGAKGKTVDDAREVVNGTEAASELIFAFGKENHESEFDWDGNYGVGFDVLHFSK